VSYFDAIPKDCEILSLLTVYLMLWLWDIIFTDCILDAMIVRYYLYWLYTRCCSDAEKRLRRDLKRTKALLHDAEVVLQKQKTGEGSKNQLRQLRNQVYHPAWAENRVLLFKEWFLFWCGSCRLDVHIRAGKSIKRTKVRIIPYIYILSEYFNSFNFLKPFSKEIFIKISSFRPNLTALMCKFSLVKRRYADQSTFF